MSSHRGAPRNDKPSSPTANGTRPPLDASVPELCLYIDGGSRGNPGPAACAVMAKSAKGDTLKTFSKFLETATNNAAEYEALLAALEYALAEGCRRVRVISDSELLVRQIEGRYRVKSPDLRIRWHRAMQLIARFEVCELIRAPREELREVDRLVLMALDAQECQGASTPE